MIWVEVRANDWLRNLQKTKSDIFALSGRINVTLGFVDADVLGIRNTLNVAEEATAGTVGAGGLR
jgi:hypothetical protein